MDLRYLRASDGNGPAAPATVTAARLPGADLLIVDAVTNWPDRFIATAGVYDEENKTLEISTVRVFSGHIDDSKIIIDEFAPGFLDEGNSVGDKVFIKPASEFSDKLVDLLGVSHKDDGSLRQVDSGAPGILLSTSATEPAPDPNGRIVIWFEPMS